MPKEIKAIDLETPSLDKLVSEIGGSVFLLTRIAMTRALEIHCGSVPLVPYLPTEKETSIALREIAAGYIVSKEKGLKLAGTRKLLKREEILVKEVVLEVDAVLKD